MRAARFVQARAQEQRGNLVAAEATYKGILERHPGYIDCFHRLSACALTRGSVDDAIAWLEHATELDDNNPDTWIMLGNLHMRERDPKQAGPGQGKTVGEGDLGRWKTTHLCVLAHRRKSVTIE